MNNSMLLKSIAIILLINGVEGKAKILKYMNVSGAHLELSGIFHEFGLDINPRFDVNERAETCTSNENCKEPQICSWVYELASGYLEHKALYCMDPPLIDEWIVLSGDPNIPGLNRCNDWMDENASCNNEELCLIPKIGLRMQGYCAKVKFGTIKQHGFLLNATDDKRSFSRQCTDDADCNERCNMTASCNQLQLPSYLLVSYKNGDNFTSTNTFKGCQCVPRTETKCEVGEKLTPEVGCDKATLGMRIDGEWCDEKQKIRCKGTSTSKCDDGRTERMLEPKCEKDRCMKEGGTCQDGQCCPKYDSNKKYYTEDYETEIPCNGQKVNDKHPSSICNTTSHKLLLLGNKRSEEIIKENGKDTKCDKDEDCAELSGDHSCYKPNVGKTSFCIPFEFKKNWDILYAAPTVSACLFVVFTLFVSSLLCCIGQYLMSKEAYYDKNRQSAERFDGDY